jgi:SAM-dependent methyltransferase
VTYPRGDEYQRRFDALAAAGHDVHGEATFVRAYEPRSVLDAGCGTGRVAIELARHGIEVIGVDVDAEMLNSARRQAPELDWRLADLADVDLGRHDLDVVVLAGNVLLFVAPGTEASVLRNLAGALRTGGRLVAGFQLQPGRYGLETLDRDAAAAGLELESRWATWDRDPFDHVAPTYAVSVFTRLPT